MKEKWNKLEPLERIAYIAVAACLSAVAAYLFWTSTDFSAEGFSIAEVVSNFVFAVVFVIIATVVLPQLGFAFMSILESTGPWGAGIAVAVALLGCALVYNVLFDVPFWDFLH